MNLQKTVVFFLLGVALWIAPIVLFRVMPILPRLDIDSRCEPDGVSGKIRALLHGRDFWSAQLELLDRQTAGLQSLLNTVTPALTAPPVAHLRASVSAESPYDAERRAIDLLIVESSRKTLQHLGDCRPLVVQRAAR